MVFDEDDMRTLKGILSAFLSRGDVSDDDLAHLLACARYYIDVIEEKENCIEQQRHKPYFERAC